MSEPKPVVRRSLLRSALEYTAGSGLGLVGSILRVGVAARLLSTEDRGLWIGLQVAFAYAQNLHLGVVFGMFRDVPMRLSRGDLAGADRSKRTSLTFILLTSALAGIVTAIYTLTSVEPRHRVHVAEVALLSFVTLLKSHYVTSFKAESRFRELSVSAVAGSIVSVVTVGLIWVGGLDGLIGGMILQAVVELLMLFRHELSIKLGIDLGDLKSSVTIGALTLGVTLAATLLTTLDRTVMLQALGATATGAYYLGANVLALLPAVAGLPGDVLTPRFFERYGATGDGKALLPLVERPMRAGSILYMGVVAVGWFAIPPVVGLLWPALVPGDTAARLALAATFPLVLAQHLSKVFYAMNRQHVQLGITLVSASVGFGVAHALVAVHPTIAAVAAGVLGGFCFHYLAMLFAAYVLMTGRALGALPLLAQTALPGLVGVALLVALELATASLGPPESIVHGAVAELGVVAVLGPWAYVALRRLRAGG